MHHRDQKVPIEEAVNLENKEEKPAGFKYYKNYQKLPLHLKVAEALQIQELPNSTARV
jgi:hypothetical protein